MVISLWDAILASSRFRESSWVCHFPASCHFWLAVVWRPWVRHFPSSCNFLLEAGLELMSMLTGEDSMFTSWQLYSLTYGVHFLLYLTIYVHLSFSCGLWSGTQAHNIEASNIQILVDLVHQDYILQMMLTFWRCQCNFTGLAWPWACG